ncbi:MAG: DUF58 domain-containing protein [Acidimicrobiales bacterium]
MSGPTVGLDGSTREVLRRLELEVTHRLDGLLHGDHRGLVPGHGTELGETREYAPGDDVRRIDWNVSARLPEVHIRQTIAERELETWLVVDRSPRLDFGSARCEKRELTLAAAAAVGFLTNSDGNRIGALLAGRGAPLTLPARGSRTHLLRILHELAATPREDGRGVTDLVEPFERLTTLARRRGLVVAISDFRVQPGWERALAVLARRHEVLAVEVSDPLEHELPDVGLLPVIDPATGEITEVPTHKPKVRAAYAAAAAERRATLEDTFRRHRIDHLSLRTDHDWLDEVVHFIARRRHRLRRAS